MSESIKIKLKPCPFCGNECVGLITEKLPNHVACFVCCAEVSVFGHDDPIEVWNNRVEPDRAAPDPPKPDDFERMRRQLWVDVYTRAFETAGGGDGALYANEAVENFDKQFKVES